MSNSDYQIHQDHDEGVSTHHNEPPPQSTTNNRSSSMMRPSTASSTFQPQPVYYSNNAGNHSSYASSSLPPPNYYPNNNGVVGGNNSSNSTPFNPSVTNFKSWKLACGITSIMITIMGGLLAVHHFIAMIVWYAKNVPSFGTANLFIILMDVVIVLIGVCGIMGVFKENETAAKFHAFGVTFGSIFVFIIFFIFSLPSFFGGSYASALLYDGIISLLFYVADIPVGIIGSIVGHMYLKVLTMVLARKQQMDSAYPTAGNTSGSNQYNPPQGF